MAVSICDCTEHMVNGRGKDVEFIMNFFKEKVENFNSGKQHTECFF